MSYTSYGCLIVTPHSVDLSGWPDDIPHTQPHKLNAEQVKKLYQLWCSGGCHWYKMMKDQHQSAIQKLQKEGDLKAWPQKPQADKGVKHK